MTDEKGDLCECGHKKSEHENLQTETNCLVNLGRCKIFNEHFSPSGSAHIICGCEQFKKKEEQN